MKNPIVLIALLTACLASCTESNKSSSNDSAKAVASVKANINGSMQTFYSPATPIDTLAEEPVDTNGTAFWIATGDTIGVFCSKKIGADTVMLFAQAVMPQEKIGVYSLDWQGVNLSKLENSEALPLSCYYGRFKDIDTTLSKSCNTSNREAYLKKIANCKGSGKLTITSFKNQQLSGTFNFNCYLGPNIQATVTDGVFTNINKGYLN